MGHSQRISDSREGISEWRRPSWTRRCTLRKHGAPLPEYGSDFVLDYEIQSLSHTTVCALLRSNVCNCDAPHRLPADVFGELDLNVRKDFCRIHSTLTADVGPPIAATLQGMSLPTTVPCSCRTSKRLRSRLCRRWDSGLHLHLAPLLSKRRSGN